jgi:hypothetical protein
LHPFPDAPIFISQAPVSAPDARDCAQPSARHCAGGNFDPRENPMSKEKNKGNKETKKPKKEKVKVLATANSNAGKDAATIAGKKIK